MKGACALGAAIAALGFAAAAVPAYGEADAGPALTNDGAVFGDYSRDGWWVKLAAADGSVRVLHQFDSLVRRRSSYVGSIAASGGRVAVADTQQHCYRQPDGTQDVVCDPVRAEYREAAPAEATSRSLEVCDRPAHYPPEAQTVDVTDGAAAYIGCNADDRDAIVVRSLADPAAAPFVIPPPAGYAFDAVRMAGRYVAGELVASTGETRGPVLVVYDSSARQEVYRVSGYSSARAILDYPPQPDFALQDDGTAVVLRAMPGRCGVGPTQYYPEYYTPGEPFAHRLSRPACWYGLALADGRVVYDGASPARPARPQLLVTSLAGGPEVPAAPTGSPGWDVDATRIAYTEDTCTTIAGRVVVRSFEELSSKGFRPANRCPIRFARKRGVVERRSGVLATRVVCPRGCMASLKVVPVGRRTPYWAYDFTVRAGVPKTVTGIQLYYGDDTRRTIIRRKCAITLTAYQPDNTEKKVRIVRRLRISTRA